MDEDFFSLFKSYLTDRFQYTCVKNQNSGLLCCVSRAPQDSVLGPLFFLLFINDLPSIFVDSIAWLFADDLKLLFANLNFHDDLWRLHSWNLFNGMIVDSLKTKCIHFNGSPDIIFPPDVKLENVTNHKDLGILMHNDLKWSFHVKTKLQKALQTFLSVKSKIPFNTPALTIYRIYTTPKLRVNLTILF